MRTLKTIRRPKPRDRDANQRLTREQVLKVLAADTWSLFSGVEHPALAGFPMAEREAIAQESERSDWNERERRREPELRRRLAEWPVSKWGAVFAERPDFEDTLTPEQANTWQKWKNRKR